MRPLRRLTIALLFLAAVSCRTVSHSNLNADGASASQSSMNGGIFSLGTLGDTKQCVDVPMGTNRAGLDVREFSCNGSLAQLFLFDESTDGTWRILSINSGLCLDVEGASLSDKAPIQTYTCNGSDAQKFSIVDKGKGNVEIQNIASRKCIDIDGQKAADGRPVQQFSCLNSEAQTFHPIPLNRPLRIMPLGASIMQGFGGSKAGARGYLHQLFEEARVPHVFVGSNLDQPGDLPVDQRHHEGHPGWTIDDVPGRASGITPRTAAWVKATNPEIIMILIGNNDIGQNYKTNEMGARLQKLLEIINNPSTGAGPHARVLVATLPLINDKAEEQKSIAYQEMMRTVIANMKAADRNVDLVDVHSVITPADKTDNFHPNDAGHKKIARLWFNAIMGRH